MTQTTAQETIPSIEPRELYDLIKTTFRGSYIRELLTITQGSELMHRACEDALARGLLTALEEAVVFTLERNLVLTWFGKGSNTLFLVKECDAGLIVLGHAIHSRTLWNAYWNCVFFIAPHNEHEKWIVFGEDHGRPEYFVSGDDPSHKSIDELTTGAKDRLHRIALGMIGVEVGK